MVRDMTGSFTGQEVVITGLGAITPVGNDRETTWRNLLAGQSGIARITAFEADGLPTQIAGEVKGFDPASLLATKRLRRSARFTQLAISAAREAVADAGLNLETEDPTRIGVVINCAVAGFDTIEESTRRLLDPNMGHIHPHFVSSSLTNMPACEVSIDLGLHGPVTASALACASGLYAILEARRLILAGEADVVVCGGTDAGITPVMFAGLNVMGVLSNNNDNPAEASRPFDSKRDGFVFSEGAVVAVLESAAHAGLRGKVPYAAVVGGALTADAYHVSAPNPDGQMARASISMALQRSGVLPEEVDYICAHGTSTKANDRVETAAIRSVFGEAADKVAISSPKSMVGHMIGAAGSLATMVCALSIRDRIVPPTINLDYPDPECDLDYVPHKARPLRVRTAVANAFGFGGQNCVVVFSEA